MFEWLWKSYPNMDLMTANQAGETSFIVAAREGKLDFLKSFIECFTEENEFDINHKMKDGWTALFYASLNGFVSVVEYLKSKNANVSATDRLFKTPLHYSARYNNIRMSKVLLDLGVKYDLKDIE